MLEEELERLGYAVVDGNERNGSGAKAWLKAMLAAAAVAGWMHYITVGPNREDEDKPEVIGKDGKILHGEEDA